MIRPVECCFTSTETRRRLIIVRDGSPGRPSRLSHSSWALIRSSRLAAFGGCVRLTVTAYPVTGHWNVTAYPSYCSSLKFQAPPLSPTSYTTRHRAQQGLCWQEDSGWLVECCFTSTETVGLLGTGTQDGRLCFHTAPELWDRGGDVELHIFGCRLTY